MKYFLYFCLFIAACKGGAITTFPPFTSTATPQVCFIDGKVYPRGATFITESTIYSCLYCECQPELPKQRYNCIFADCSYHIFGCPNQTVPLLTLGKCCPDCVEPTPPTTTVPSSPPMTAIIPSPTPSSGCELNGIKYAVGDPMPSDDPCQFPCFCDEGNIPRCAIVDCAFYFIGCPEGKEPLFIPGQCCPECVLPMTTMPISPPTTTAMPSPTPTSGCVLNGTRYDVGDLMPFDNLCRAPCLCTEGNIRSCAIVDCLYDFFGCPEGQEPLFIPGQCCPECVLPTTTTPISLPTTTAMPSPTPTSGCVLNGTHYALGDEMPYDYICAAPCFCEKGITGYFRNCAVVDCPFLECPIGKNPQYLPDQCCPICVPAYPNCSFHYCTKEKGNLCVRTDAVTKQMTSCNACYFAQEERTIPEKCNCDLKRYRCDIDGLSGDQLESRLKKWGKCMKKSFNRLYGKTPKKLRKAELFRCPACPCGDLGK